MIDWPKVVQDLEKENARLKKALAEQEQDLREFGVEVAMKVYNKFEYGMSNFELEQIVDEVMKNG